MPPDSAMEEAASKSVKLQKWLDQNQYATKGILKYERIFGKTYVSVGGETTTSEFTEMLGLHSGMKVLDIGCGIGGSAFYMARRYLVDVLGIDLSSNMIGLAQDYRTGMEPAVKHRVQFYVEDAVEMQYPVSFYDVVYSRDTILHISDKLGLFKRFFTTLKPGGRILISDYCRGEQAPSQRFEEYVASRDYHLHTVKDYGTILENAGFTQVKAVDMTDKMVEMLKKELQTFENIKDAFIDEFSEEDFENIKQGWLDKVVRCGEGDQKWGMFTGVKQ